MTEENSKAIAHAAETYDRGYMQALRDLVEKGFATPHGKDSEGRPAAWRVTYDGHGATWSPVKEAE
jgi:hypothetical protein